MRNRTPNRSHDARITLRLPASDKAVVIAKAQQANLGLNDYILRTALQRPINTSNTVDLINELRALAMQQKECVRQDRRNEHKYLEILEAIVAAILAIPRRIPTKKRESPWAHGL